MNGSETATSGYRFEEHVMGVINSNSEFQKIIEDTIELPSMLLATKANNGLKHDVVICSQSTKQLKHIQVKKFTSTGGNQVDRRWPFVESDDKAESWKHIILPEYLRYLEKYTAEATYYTTKLRIRPQDFPEDMVTWLVGYQEEIVDGCLSKGGQLDYFFCGNPNKLYIFLHKDLRELILSQPLQILPNRNTIQIGKNLTWQRKGGDGGAFEACQLQAKLQVDKSCKELLSLGKATLIDFSKYTLVI